jgi:uncharacterized protein (TIGR03086 family)
MSSAAAGSLSPMTSFVDLAPAAERIVGMLPRITDEMLPAATPCAGIAVDGLLSHLIGLSIAFRDGAHKAPDSGPPPEKPPALVAGWRAELPARLDELVTAWRSPEARTGVTSVGGGEMPADTMAVIALDELVLHGWDLARSTGQEYRADPRSVEACLEFVAMMSKPEGVPGLFGPPVPVPADAPALPRLLGLSGRDPAWSAG